MEMDELLTAEHRDFPVMNGRKALLGSTEQQQIPGQLSLQAGTALCAQPSLHPALQNLLSSLESVPSSKIICAASVPKLSLTSL